MKQSQSSLPKVKQVLSASLSPHITESFLCPCSPETEGI